jgi:hypothetical protein
VIRYDFLAHTYDFFGDRVTGIISLFIILNILVALVLTLWRTFTGKGNERWPVLTIGLCYTLATLVPAVANALSRSGGIDRGTFQNIWVLANVAGFFLVIIAYVNNTRERMSFMGRIIGVSLIAILAVMQIVSYYMLREKEFAFDGLYDGYARVAGLGGTTLVEPERVYIRSLFKTAPADDDPDATPAPRDAGIPASEAVYLDNTLFADALLHAEVPAADTLSALHAAVWQSRPAAADNAAITARITAMNGAAAMVAGMVSMLPAESLRAAVGGLGPQKNPDASAYIEALKVYMASSKSEGPALQKELFAASEPGTSSGYAGVPSRV